MWHSLCEWIGQLSGKTNVTEMALSRANTSSKAADVAKSILLNKSQATRILPW